MVFKLKRGRKKEEKLPIEEDEEPGVLSSEDEDDGGVIDLPDLPPMPKPPKFPEKGSVNSQKPVDKDESLPTLHPSEALAYAHELSLRAIIESFDALIAKLEEQRKLQEGVLREIRGLREDMRR